MSRFVADARAYAARGWSVLPVKGKRAACPWRALQSRPATDADLRRWFSDTQITGLAVICGAVSGGLCVRDFDIQAAYDRWALDHPALARSLPTVKTARGAHVYFRSPETTRIIDKGDGELRGAGYCLLPPSTHPSGVVYRWAVPLPEGELPVVQPEESGLAASADATEETEETEAIGGGGLSVSSVSSVSSVALDRIITATLPTAARQRNKLLFSLCRKLHGIPGFAGADVAALKPIVQRWHELARPHVGTKEWETTWLDFCYGWSRVRHPASDDWMDNVLTRARTEAELNGTDGYEHPGIRVLVVICRVLQADAGDEPFFLSCRSAGAMLGVDHATVARWLAGLVVDKVLIEIVKGTATTRRATRYRYAVARKVEVVRY